MRAFGKITVVRAALFLFFLFAAVLPLLGMFAGLFSPEAQSVFGSERFAAACWALHWLRLPFPSRLRLLCRGCFAVRTSVARG